MNAPKKRVLVYTEGDTENSYLQFWYRLHTERVALVIGKDHGDPLTLVRNAVDSRRWHEREAKRGRGAGFDEYWCMFDVDEHETLDEALRVAALEGIQIALSNPCLELWFVLHAHDQTAYIHRSDIQKRSKTLYGFEKTPTPDDLELLKPKYLAAKARAQALDSRHEGNGSPPKKQSQHLGLGNRRSDRGAPERAFSPSPLSPANPLSASRSSVGGRRQISISTARSSAA